MVENNLEVILEMVECFSLMGIALFFFLAVSALVKIWIELNNGDRH